MSTEQEKKILHHYQHQREDGTAYTINVYRLVEGPLITYEIETSSMRLLMDSEIDPDMPARFKSEIYSEYHTDPTEVNTRFLILIGAQVK